ncbi:glycosyltransferase [Parabacteroides distasonis]|nr:glycosyltransferase [Parabacteroides distasonis]
MRKYIFGDVPENVKQFASKVYVVDCFSIDRTAQIAKELGAEVIEHEWPGNQAEQFNWALDNLPITTEWILRLDADEYLLPGLIEELPEKLPLYRRVFRPSLSLSRALSAERYYITVS